MRPRNYELYDINKITELRKIGKNISQIADDIGANRRRLAEWLKRCYTEKITVEYVRK